MIEVEEEMGFARSALGGKRTNRAEARVTDELKFDLQRRCHELGMSESDFIEMMLTASLYGVAHVRTVHEQRLSAVCGLSALMPQGGQL